MKGILQRWLQLQAMRDRYVRDNGTSGPRQRFVVRVDSYKWTSMWEYEFHQFLETILRWMLPKQQLDR